MKPRILILTAGFGEGHNAAARALAAAFDEDASAEAKVVDLFALTRPRFNRIARRAYLAAINGAPRLWRGVYRWMDHPSFPPLASLFIGGDSRRLGEMLDREQPAAICSSFPAYAYLLARLAAGGRVPVAHFNIVTDSISINSLWWRGGGDGWFVPNEDSAGAMKAAGVDPARIHVTGFPVTLFFSRHAGELAPPDLAAGGRPRVLYIVNSGTRGAEATARLLLAETDWDLTCTVGRDDALRQKLAGLARQRRGGCAEILGWTDQIPRLLMTHHAVVSKAGGATTQEAVAARCPMIVNQVVPGQEEGNYELLRRHGAGTLAPTPAAIVAALRGAFADHGRVWSEWRAALAPLSRPDAARAIAAHVLARAGGPPHPDRPAESLLVRARS